MQTEILLKIREKRHERAESEVRQSRLALARAHQELEAAQAMAVRFAAQRRREIQSIYNALIGKKILRRALDEARSAERSLNEKLAALKAEVKNCEHHAEEKKKLLAQAHQRFMASQKGLAKAEEIYAEAMNENRRAESLREDMLIDEFAEQMRH